MKRFFNKEYKNKESNTNNKLYKIILVATGMIILVCMIILGVTVYNGYRDYKENERMINEYMNVLNKGKSSLDAGNYDEAIKAYKEAIELQPNNSLGYVGLSNAYELIGDTNNARLILEQGYIRTGDASLF